MMEMLTNLVTQSGVGATQLSAILLGVLFLIMIIGLATGQELAFVLGGAGVVIGYLAWGGPGITIAMTKVYDQMQSYSMVAIPMFVLMANFLTHSKVADGLFLSIRYLLRSSEGRSRSGGHRGFHGVRRHDRHRRRVRCYDGHAVRTGPAQVRLQAVSGVRHGLCRRLARHSHSAVHHARLDGLLCERICRQDLLRRDRCRVLSCRCSI